MFIWEVKLLRIHVLRMNTGDRRGHCYASMWADRSGCYEARQHPSQSTGHAGSCYESMALTFRAVRSMWQENSK